MRRNPRGGAEPTQVQYPRPPTTGRSTHRLLRSSLRSASRPPGRPELQTCCSSQTSTPNSCRGGHDSREEIDGVRRVTVAKLYRLPGSAGDARSWLATRGHPSDMTCQAAQPKAASAVWKLAQLPGSAPQAPLGLPTPEDNPRRIGAGRRKRQCSGRRRSKRLAGGRKRS